MQLGAGEFKAKCLKLMDEIAQTRECLVITKHGKPLVKMIPYEDQPPNIFGYLRGSVKINGDIIESSGEAWDVDG